MFFDPETCPGPSLVCSSGLPRVDPFLGSVLIIALSHVDSKSHLLKQYRTRYMGHFLNSLSPRDRREDSTDTDRNFDFTSICNDYTPEARKIKGETLKLMAFILSFSTANPCAEQD
jgi:hypothetical protein